MTNIRTVAIACALVLAVACSKKEKDEKQGLPPAGEWQAPANTPSAPGVGKVAPPPGVPNTNPHAGMAGAQGNPHAGMAGAQGDPHAGMAGAQGNPHGGMAGAQGNPHGGNTVDVESLGLKPPEADRKIDPDKYIKGTIKPTAETKVGIPKGAVIFLSVKRANPKTGEPMGAPLAVKRLRLSTWPVWFNLTEEDAMIAGTRFEGEVVVTAWADQDQDAISKSPGDVLGTAKATIPVKDLEVRLDTVLK